MISFILGMIFGSLLTIGAALFFIARHLGKVGISLATAYQLIKPKK